MSATELLTAEQVAEALSISTRQVRVRTKTDGWPHVRLSPKTIRYRPEHVDTIIGLYDQAQSTPAAPVGLAGQTAGSRRRAS